MLKPPFPEVESEVTATELGLSTFALSCGWSTDFAGALACGMPFLSISERNAVKKICICERIVENENTFLYVVREIFV